MAREDLDIGTAAASDAIAGLPEREKLVVALYYHENLTQRAIGELLGVTDSRVSQLHRKAVQRLRSRPGGGGRRDRAAGLSPRPSGLERDGSRV